MIAQIQFFKMDRSLAIEEYVGNQLLSLQHHIPHNKEAHFKVWLECLNSQAQIGPDLFRCAIEIDGLKRKQYFVEKRDQNFYRAVNHCIDVLDQIFSREKKNMTSQKRKAAKFKPEFAAS